MSVRTTLTAVSVAVACTINPRIAPPPTRPASVAGCYSLTVGKWNPGMHALDDRLPAIIELTNEQSQSAFGGGSRAVRPVIPAPRWASAFWSERGDSVRVTWTNGFAGFDLRLVASADSLYGNAERFTDLIGATAPRAAVIARRIRCDQ